MLAQQCLVLLLLLVLFLHDGEALRRRRRRRAPPPCHARNCQVGAWSTWSACSHRCGTAETQYRTRNKIAYEQCGGTCYASLREDRHCHVYPCQNGGIPLLRECKCKTGFTGICCELDKNECRMNVHYCSPGGTCVNTHGSYRCVCKQGYVSSHGGTACGELPDVGQCRINGEEATSKSVIEGTKVTMSCDVTGSEPLNVTWNKEHTKTSLAHSNTLIFDSILRGDSGQYRVTVYSGRVHGKTMTKILHLTVMYLDEPIVQGKRYRVVNENNPKAQFTITVQSNAQPNLVCHKKNTENQSTKNTISVDSQVVGTNWTFVIDIIANEDGEYVCTVRSSAKKTTITGLGVYLQIPPETINGTFTLTKGTWHNDLSNANSYYYKDLKNQVEDELTDVYQGEDFVSDTRVLGFLKGQGSIVVIFQLEVVANVPDPIMPLKNAVKRNGGSLGDLVIDPQSIKKDGGRGKAASQTESISTDEEWIIIGVASSVGVAIFIAILVALYFCCKKKHRGLAINVELQFCCKKKRGEETLKITESRNNIN